MYLFVIYLHAVPSASPQSLTVMAVDSRTIELNWLPPPEEHRNGLIVRYVVNVSSESGESFQLHSMLPRFSAQMLRPFTTYSCAVAAETIAVGPFTSIMQIKTPEDGEYILY